METRQIVSALLLAMLVGLLSCSCWHSSATAELTDREIAAVAAGSYCLAVVGQSNYATFAVPRDYSATTTCAASCLQFVNDKYPGANGVHLSGRGVADLECTIHRDANGRVLAIDGRPSSDYLEKDTPNCDWCCCQAQ